MDGKVQNGVSWREEHSRVARVNSLLEAGGISRRIHTLDNCSPSMFVVLFERLFSVPRLSGVIRPPVTRADHVWNAQRVLDVLEDVTGVTMEHISSEGVVERDGRTLCELIDIFGELYTLYSSPEEEGEEEEEEHEETEGEEEMNDEEEEGEEEEQENVCEEVIEQPRAQSWAERQQARRAVRIRKAENVRGKARMKKFADVCHRGVVSAAVHRASVQEGVLRRVWRKVWRAEKERAVVERGIRKAEEREDANRRAVVLQAEAKRYKNEVEVLREELRAEERASEAAKKAGRLALEGMVREARGERWIELQRARDEMMSRIDKKQAMMVDEDTLVQKVLNRLR